MNPDKKIVLLTALVVIFSIAMITAFANYRADNGQNESTETSEAS